MASKRQIIITKADRDDLESLFVSEFAMAFGDKPYLQSLRQAMNRASGLGFKIETRGNSRYARLQ